MKNKAGRYMAVLRDFKRLDAEYRANTTDSPAVEALNTLPPDERALAILYTASGGNSSATATYLHCDRHTLDRYIYAIRIKMEDAVNGIMRRQMLAAYEQNIFDQAQ